jgi:predicted dienelactone hydrolase
MRRLLFAAFVLGAMFNASVSFAQETGPTGIRPDAPPYAIRGQYAVGTMEFTIEDEERPLSITIWYPALNPDAVEEIASYSIGIMNILGPDFDTAKGHAIRNASPDAQNGPYPMAIYSPGMFASRLFGLYLTEHLASWGFVVVAVDHPGTSLIDYIIGTEANNAKNIIADLFYRPSDMLRVIDYADILTAAGGTLERTIDTERIAVMGWSTGGTTAFATAGARIDFDGLDTWCAEHDSAWYAHEASQYLGQEETLATLYGIDPETRGLWPAISDARVDALVGFAPGGELPVFGADGMAEISVPALLFDGTGETLVSPEHNAIWAYELINNPQKSVVMFENGDHFLFGDMADAWGDFGFDLISDPVWDMDRAHDLINHFTTSFLLSVFYEDANAAAALSPDEVAFPGITYETTR